MFLFAVKVGPDRVLVEVVWHDPRYYSATPRCFGLGNGRTLRVPLLGLTRTPTRRNQPHSFCGPAIDN